jgi:CBS domain containing-hemolysin-like protein
MMEGSLFEDLLRLLALAALVGANAFFVAAEFALVSVRRTRVEELVTQGSRAARWVQHAIQDPDRFIAATQLGITLASLGLGWVAEPALAHLLEPAIRLFPSAAQPDVSLGLSAAFAFALITFLHVVVGELAPKSIALQNPERTSLVVARPIAWTALLFKPAIWALNGSGNLLLRLLGFRPASARQMVHSVEELKMLVSASAQSGVVEADEQDMVHAIFDFGDMLVRQVMIPRTEIVGVPADATLEEIIAIALQHSFARFPVYEGSLDQVLGIVHLRDIMRARHAGRSSPSTARGLMREALFVPETVGVAELLRRFRARRHRLAIVLDEYGGTAGLVTLEDLLEQIVGDVNDEFESAQAMQRLPDGSSLVDGLTPIDEVNEFFHIDLHDPHYDTIAGFMLGRLGRIAQVGDTVTAGGVRLRVEALDGLRIARITLIPASAPTQPPPPEAASS